MSGGGGGIIIIEDGDKQTRLEVYVNDSVSQQLKQELYDIQDRSVVHISALDKLRLFKILWKILP